MEYYYFTLLSLFNMLLLYLYPMLSSPYVTFKLIHFKIGNLIELKIET